MKNLKICPGWIVLGFVILYLFFTRENYVATPGIIASNEGSIDSDYDDRHYNRRVHGPFQFVSPESWPFPLQNTASALNVPAIGPLPFPYIDQLGYLK